MAILCRHSMTRGSLTPLQRLNPLELSQTQRSRLQALLQACSWTLHCCATMCCCIVCCCGGFFAPPPNPPKNISRRQACYFLASTFNQNEDFYSRLLAVMFLIEKNLQGKTGTPLRSSLKPWFSFLATLFFNVSPGKRRMVRFRAFCAEVPSLSDGSLLERCPPVASLARWKAIEVIGELFSPQI